MPNLVAIGCMLALLELTPFARPAFAFAWDIILPGVTPMPDRSGRERVERLKPRSDATPESGKNGQSEEAA